MSAVPDGITREEIERYAKLDKGIKALQDEHKILGEKIKKAYTEAYMFKKNKTFSVGNIILKISKTVGTFDKKSAEATFPYSVNPELYTPAIDTKKLETEFGDARLDFYTPSTRLSVDTVE